MSDQIKGRIEGICKRQKLADHRNKPTFIHDSQWRNLYRDDVAFLLRQVELTLKQIEILENEKE